MAITDFVNLLLEGGTPSHVRSTLFGAKLFAISKKDGGARPIAVGYVWRRIAAKIACNFVSSRCSALLAPRQIGFGVACGTEAAVRATRQYTDNMEPGHVLVKLDFKNAFNTLRRDSILESVSTYCPELLPFASSSMESASVLQFGEFNLSSAEGAQQGDPLGPLYFCLAIKDVLDSLRSEFVVGYLDDVTIGGRADTVVEDFAMIESVCKSKGLFLNRLKCEVVGLSNETRTLFHSNNIELPETNRPDLVLLGSPLFHGNVLDSALCDKSNVLRLLAGRLSLMPAHDALYLLRNVLATPRLMYLLRTAPCSDSPKLQLYDEVLRQTLTSVLNVDLSDDRWLQASLPVRWGGLGIRGVTLLAPSAYLASAASTTELVQNLLPSNLSGSTDNYISSAKIAWTLSATSSTILPSTPTSATLKAWDDCCCKVQAEKLLLNAVNPAERARLLAASSIGSGDWINTLPLQSIGLKLDNSTVRIAVGLRLGAPIVRPHRCICDSMVTSDGHHGLSCRRNAGRQSRHSQINDILCRAFASADVVASREPRGLCSNGDKRPDGVTVVPWSKGRCLSWDFTCPDTFAPSHVLECSTQVGSAARKAESSKCHKYADIMSGIDFVPVAIETSGVWGERALSLVCELGRRIAAVSHDSRSTIFLRQRISVAVQRGNASSILATVV